MKDNSQNYRTGGDSQFNYRTLKENGWDKCSSSGYNIEQFYYQEDYQNVCLNVRSFLESIRDDIRRTTGSADANCSVISLLENACEQQVPRKIVSEFENLHNYISKLDESDIIFKKKDGKTCIMAIQDICKFLLTIKLPEGKKSIPINNGSDENRTIKNEESHSYLKKTAKKVVPHFVVAIIAYLFASKMKDRKNKKNGYQ